VFKHFVALRLEAETTMNEKGSVVAELSDEKWLWDLHCYVTSATT
jgi:hypothetical protein